MECVNASTWKYATSTWWPSNVLIHAWKVRGREGHSVGRTRHDGLLKHLHLLRKAGYQFSVYHVWTIHSQSLRTENLPHITLKVTADFKKQISFNPGYSWVLPGLGITGDFSLFYFLCLHCLVSRLCYELCKHVMKRNAAWNAFWNARHFPIIPRWGQKRVTSKPQWHINRELSLIQAASVHVNLACLCNYTTRAMLMCSDAPDGMKRFNEKQKRL